MIPSNSNFPLHLHGIKLGYLFANARKDYREGNLTTIQIDTLKRSQIHWNIESHKLEAFFQYDL